MMNDVLQLKGRFQQKKNTSQVGAPTLASGSFVETIQLEKLKKDLFELVRFWSNQDILDGCLISVYYNKIAAKSNRIQALLAFTGKPTSQSIVGAKFTKEQNKHIITHYVPLHAISKSIDFLDVAIKILNDEFNGVIPDIYFNKIINNKTNQNYRLDKINFKDHGISKSKFQNIIKDVSHIERFAIETSDFDLKKTAIITLYDTEASTQDILEKIGITLFSDRIINKTTILLDEDNLKILKQKAPYLIAMATENISELAPSDFIKNFETKPKLIPIPGNEPTIGVIDTLFDESVYFSQWVEFHHMIDKNIPTDPTDYRHGTAVSSIIVDGPHLNPTLNDGCGRFKVRHFGVATSKAFNSFTIMRSIKEIVLQNRDIRVWNISLGSNEEVNYNFISAEAAILDQIQFENDVVFVVAGTNKKDIAEKRIGAPADSINSVIVNSVDFKNDPASYSRNGIILSFFSKPDVSYYGGTSEKYIRVCEPTGEAFVAGTSYAAPWVARKLSYLIDIIGLTKEVAKAMLIDSAIGWNTNRNPIELALKGHGVVPVKIDDVIKSPDDEIKFVVSGISEEYDTFNYNFPVPIFNNKHPFLTKATLCYFPKCSRNQGVDYTNTELDIKFGRLKPNGNLESIDNNKQNNDNELNYLTEKSARQMFRKWDNVKHISEGLKQSRGKKVYENPMWGISIKTKERLNKGDGEGIRFGVVVTLKEVNGINRIEDFIQQCSLKGWLVNRINVENKIDIYQTANELIEFE